MKKLLKQFSISRNEIVVRESDLIKLLNILKNHRGETKLEIGSHEWERGTVWYVAFFATEAKMEKIEAELKKADFEEIMILGNVSNWVKVKKLGS